jgi:hypothetical protein
VRHGLLVITAHDKCLRAQAQTQPFEVGSQLLLNRIVPFTFDKEHVPGKADRRNGGQTRCDVSHTEPPSNDFNVHYADAAIKTLRSSDSWAEGARILTWVKIRAPFDTKVGIDRRLLPVVCATEEQ